MSRFGPFTSSLELGSRDVNGGVRDLFADHTGLDNLAGPGVDIVADAATWLPPRRYSCVVCCEVFEHTPLWPAIVATAYRALEDDGTLILTMAGPGREPHSAIDGLWLKPGEHYQNIEPDDLRAVLEAAGFRHVEILNRDVDLYAVGRR